MMQRRWNHLAAACTLAVPALVGDPATLPMPSPAELHPLKVAQQTALGGTPRDFAAYMAQDIATFWPGFAPRIRITQSDKPDPAVLRQQAAPEHAHMRAATAGGRAVTWALFAANGLPYAVISLPASLCRSCVAEPPAPPPSCRPLHPDTLFYESRSRLFVGFHEQAHALRHLQGLFSHESKTDRHREEVIANVYASLRLLQVFGPEAVAMMRLHMSQDPLRVGSSHAYISHRALQATERWYEANQAGLPHMHPALLLAQAAALAEPNLLSAADLQSIARFEQQSAFVAMGSATRQQILARSQPNATQVTDARARVWSYPRAAQKVDAEVLALGRQMGDATNAYYRANPWRPAGLQDAPAFGFDPANALQVAALVAFNNQQRPPQCRPFEASDMQPGQLALPGGVVRPNAARP